ncbi:MAG: hypothetical protein AAFV19_04960 [Pseudomonadota bacterium]
MDGWFIVLFVTLVAIGFAVYWHLRLKAIERNAPPQEHSSAHRSHAQNEAPDKAAFIQNGGLAHLGNQGNCRG